MTQINNNPNVTGDDPAQIQNQSEQGATQTPPVTPPVEPNVQPSVAQQTPPQEPQIAQQQQQQVQQGIQIAYDENGNAYIAENKYYAQKSVDEFVNVQKNENKRLAFMNKMLIDGVDATLANNLSQSIDIDKIDTFDYASMIQTAQPVQKQAGSNVPQQQPHQKESSKGKTAVDYANEYLDNR